MAKYNIEMQKRNAANNGWDKLYPVTKAQNVVAADGVTTVESHLADYVRQPGYAVATGSANTYAVTLSPAPTAYVDGMAICVKINAASTGASTINVNGLGAKTILDSLGNAITAGGLKANTPYTLRYNGTNFIVQGKGGGGNAKAADLLWGKTATVDSGPITGTMDLSNLTPSNIKNGVVINGITGTANTVNFFGNGTDGALSSTGNITFNLAADDIYSVIKQYTSFKLNAGHVLTVDKRCKGLIIYAQTAIEINGTINLDGKSAWYDPATTSVLKFYEQTPPPNLPDIINLLAPQETTLISTLARGGAGGAGGGGYAQYCRGRASSAGGAGGVGYIFGGGRAGGGAGGHGYNYNQTDEVRLGDGGSAGSESATATGQGGNGAGNSWQHNTGGAGGNAMLGGGGGGGGGGFMYDGYEGVAGAAAQGSGGGAIILVAPAIKLLSTSLLSAKGANGSNGGNGGRYNASAAQGGHGGGGNGGGLVALLYRDSIQKLGTITLNGGIGGTGGTGQINYGEEGVGLSGSSGSIGTIVEKQTTTKVLV